MGNDDGHLYVYTVNMGTLIASDKRLIIQRRFCNSVSILLCLTALAKIITIVQHRRFLDIPDGVFKPVTNQDTMALAATLEILTAVFMFVRRERLSAMVACSWLVGIFVVYRMLGKILYVQQRCPCLGGVLDWTGISPKVLDTIPVALLWYFGVGSLTSLFLSSIASKDLPHGAQSVSPRTTSQTEVA
jgi:hypothetical protein